MLAVLAAIFHVDRQKSSLAIITFIVLVVINPCSAFQSGQSSSHSENHASQQRLKNSNPSVPQLSGSQKPTVKELTFTARFHLITGTRRGVLILKAEIPPGSHIYSLTQTGSPPPSKISVTESKRFKIKGGFASDRHPKVIQFDPIFKNRIEKHSDLVQFFVPIELVDVADPAKIKPEINFDGQVCSDEGLCMPIRDRKIKATFAGYYEEQAQNQTESQNRRR